MSDAAMGSAPPWSSFVLSGARVRRLRAQSTGACYAISIWLPAGTPPPGGFPAIYVLDAQALFGTFVEAIRRASRRPDATGIAPAAVIGIAQDDVNESGDPYSAELRQRDFTPGPRADGEPALSGREGGGNGFLCFVLDELVPALAGEFPLDTSQQTLFGHSLAGLFVLHALAARPRAFCTFAAISPSIWWDADDLRARLAVLPRDGARVFIAVGEWEGDVLPPVQRTAAGNRLLQRRRERRMIANAQALAAELGERLGERNVAFRVFPEEDHASVLMIAAQRALRFALGSDTG